MTLANNLCIHLTLNFLEYLQPRTAFIELDALPAIISLTFSRDVDGRRFVQYYTA